MMPGGAKPEKDYFSAVAADYARFRPVYPPALYDAILNHVPVHDLALDCGTGNGQAAAELAKRFKTIYATDISDDQLSKAPKLSNLALRKNAGHEAPSEIADGSLDLITAAQAAHWFNPQAFVSMAKKKLKPNGVIAIWGYGVLRPQDETLARVLHDFTLGADGLGPFWDPEILMIREEYKNYPWPFDEIPAPNIQLTVRWTLPEALGYFKSWSATQKFITAHGEQALANMAQKPIAAWGAPEIAQDLFVKISIRLGRNRQG